MSNHEWCHDVPRDEAVRAAEDSAAVPSIQHRDLPEQVALLWASLGDILGRVVRIEGEIDAGQAEADTVSDEAVSHGVTLRALAESRESLAAANRGIARLRAEITRLREERRWIPVEERMPENILGKAVMRRILATDGDNVAEAKYYEGYGFESVHGEELWFTPTHWQPLPAPPSEGEVEG